MKRFIFYIRSIDGQPIVLHCYLVAGKTDSIFPIEATKKAYKELQNIYDAAGASDRCHLVVGAEGHRFYADDAWPVLEDELEKL